MKLFYCRSKHGTFVYPLSRVIKQQKKGVDTKILREVPTYDELSRISEQLKEANELIVYALDYFDPYEELQAYADKWGLEVYAVHDE